VERKVFFGIGAHYFDGTEPKIRFAAHMYNGHAPDTTKLISIDTRRSPVGAANGDCKWSEIEIDDRGLRHDGTPLVLPTRDPNTGQYTSPPEGAHVTTVGDPKDADREGKGAVYLEHGFFAKNQAAILSDPKATWPPASFEEYELITVAYSGNVSENPIKAGFRFVGMQAYVLDQRGTLVKVLLRWAPAGAWKGPVWLDLADVSDCDPDPKNPKDLTDPLNKHEFVGAGVRTGAILIRMERLSAIHSGTLTPRGPKLPIGSG
jgi:hypothetical protein